MDTSTEAEQWSPEDRLIKLQQFILAHYPGAFNQWLKYGLDSPQNRGGPLDDLRQFNQAVLSGQMPSPDVLVSIALSFERYLSQRTKSGISLDEAFNLLGKQRAGNPAQKANRDRERNQVLLDIFLLRLESEKPTIEAAIGRVLRMRNMICDVDAIASWRTRYSGCPLHALEDVTREKGFG